jgi:hypothetical protein
VESAGVVDDELVNSSDGDASNYAFDGVNLPMRGKQG